MNETVDYPAFVGVTITKKDGSLVEIRGEVPTETLHRYRMKAFRALSSELELPGFRKGHVPEEMAFSHIGEATLMQEAAERALAHAYPEMLRTYEIDAVGRPDVSITKLAAGNPLGFTITTAVYPDIVLPEYQEIAKKELQKHEDPDLVTVSAEDVQKEVRRLQKIMASQPVAGEAPTDEVDESTLPQPDDAFAQSLGDFKNLADLQDKIEAGMGLDRREKARDKRRLAMIEAILAKTDVQVPDLFVDGELDQMMGTFAEQVTRAGMRMEEYLQSVGKTEDSMRVELRPDAEKKAKIQVVLSAIAKKETIVPIPEKLEREVAHIAEHYPSVDVEGVRSFVTIRMTNELVLAFLEGRQHLSV